MYGSYLYCSFASCMHMGCSMDICWNHALDVASSVVRRGDIGAGFHRAASHLLPPAAFHQYQMCAGFYLSALTCTRWPLWPRAWHSSWCRLLSAGIVAVIVAGVAGTTCALVAAACFSVGCCDELLLFPKLPAAPVPAAPPRDADLDTLL